MRNIIGWASFIRWLSVGNVDIFEQGKQQDAPVRTMPRYKEIVQIFDVGSQLVFVDSYYGCYHARSEYCVDVIRVEILLRCIYVIALPIPLFHKNYLLILCVLSEPNNFFFFFFFTLKRTIYRYILFIKIRNILNFDIFIQQGNK